MAQAPQPMGGGQASSSTGDLATQLLSIVRQLSHSNQTMLNLIAAIEGINFPQNTKGYTVATLPATPGIGFLAYVTDGTSGLTWGQTVTGGHSTTYLVWFNGTNYTVVGQ